MNFEPAPNESAPLPAEREILWPPQTRPPAPPRRRVILPLVLFALTCWTTYAANGLAYAVPLMLILLAHEFGHFLQAVRYRVPASFPFFIPMPFPPLGTMGAVIGMGAHEGDRRALFDIAITGPIAGFIPALFCCVIGLNYSTVRTETVLPPTLEAVRQQQRAGEIHLGSPLIFQWIEQWQFGELAENQDVVLHPLAFAGWVGLLVTALNLIPIGQLDGGHILYALLQRKAHFVSQGLMIAAITMVFVMRYWGWSVFLALLLFIGTKHPPTADDTVPLGLGRTVLGWAALLFVVIGFTPTPFLLE